MSTNRWDGTLNGVKFRLRRGDGAYNRFFSRQQVEEQFVLPTGGRTSRADRRKFHQTNWAGGSAWWRPLLNENLQDMYQFSRGLDVFSQAGNVVALNKTTSNTPTDRGMTTGNNGAFMVVGPFDSYFSTVVGVDSTGLKLRYWDHGTAAWVNSTQSFASDFSLLRHIAYNLGDENYYVASSSTVARMPKNNSSAAVAMTGATYPGLGFNTVFVPGLTGRMNVWDGDKLYEVNDDDTFSVVTDDGFGNCISGEMDTIGTLTIEPRVACKTAVSTSEGIYYVKSIWSGGVPQPWLFRVERDAAGNTVSVPVATLPPGRLALSLGWAMGTPIIVTTRDWALALENDGTDYSTEVWSVFGGTLGLLGQIYARDPDDYTAEEPTETVCQFIGTHDDLVLFGSTNGIWGYDAVRGGIHKLWEYSPHQENEYAFLQWPRQNKVLTSSVEISDITGTYDVPTSTLGTDDDTMTLYSAFFDFNLPGEDKTITKVKTVSNEAGIATTNQWRVHIIDEAGNVTDINHDHTNVQEKETTGLSITGEKFRYRLIYEQTSGSAQPQPLAGIFITAESGETVQGWQLIVDGTEFMNVENEVQNPETVYDNWVTLGQNQTAITFEDNFEAYDRADKTSHTVRVQSVQIQKTDAAESIVQVTLIDAS